MKFREKLVQLACDISNKLRNVSDVEVADIQNLSADELLLIDVRPEKERTVSILPTAITAKEIQDSPSLAEGKMVVAYCTAGYRSGVFAQQHCPAANSEHDTAEPTQIHNLRGGILAWCHAELPLEDPNGQTTHRVHVYSKEWNLVTPPYIGVW